MRETDAQHVQTSCASLHNAITELCNSNPRALSPGRSRQTFWLEASATDSATARVDLELARSRTRLEAARGPECGAMAQRRGAMMCGHAPTHAHILSSNILLVLEGPRVVV